MQILEKVRQVETAGIGQVFKATIKASEKVFSFFSDQIYTDKPRTIVREYTANGIDEHNQSGNIDARMIITLPTADKPYLSFRDFGRGMSHLFITTSFMAYSDGTTKTDDNVAIGGLGIGSKSGFSYTDQFVIRSIHEGMSRTYSMFKGEDGIPGIALLDEQVSDEPNGCEIMIPIEAEDFDRFKEAAEEVLGYFQPQPVLIGGKIKQPNYIATGNNWAVRKEAGDLAVIMGGVRYPVLKSALPWDVRNDDLVGYGIDLTMPIGSCQVALSREALSMDDSTTANVIRALRSCRDDIVASFATMFDRYTSSYEASKALGEMEKGNAARFRVLSTAAKYKGEDLRVMYRCEGIEASRHDTRGRRSTISKFDWIVNPTIKPGIIRYLIIDDLPDDNRKRLLARVKHSYADLIGHGFDTIIVRGGKLDSILEALGNPADYVLASSLEVPPPAPRFTGARTTQRVFRSNHSAYGRNDLVELDDLTERDVVVQMTAFEEPAGFHTEWHSRLIPAQRVVFANKLGAEALLNTGKYKSWAQAYTEAREELLGKVEADTAFIKWIKEEDHDLGHYYTKIARMRTALGTLTPAQKKRPFGRIVELFDRYYSVSNPEGYILVEAKRPPNVFPDRIAEAFEKQQPKLVYMLEQLRYHTPDATVMSIIEDYI